MEQFRAIEGTLNTLNFKKKNCPYFGAEESTRHYELNIWTVVFEERV